MKRNFRFTRRDFLKTSVATFATLNLVPRHVLGGGGVTPPSEVLTKAVIGVGGMGQGHLKAINPTAKLLAVCDVDENHLKAALKIAGEEVKAYRTSARSWPGRTLTSFISPRRRTGTG